MSSSFRCWISWISPIVGFVIFQRSRESGDLRFGTSARAFVLHVATGGENQSRENDDDRNDDQEFKNGKAAL